jgi:hypothetical protein
LAAPIIDITFGYGPNPGPPIAAAATNYQYVNYTCPNDGFYSLMNSCSGCFYGDWHNITQDHTGNPNGYFMLVNSSFEPGNFYLDTIKQLCGNTSYEFGAWVLNVDNPTACPGTLKLPNITFLVKKTDGTVLQSYNTGDIAAVTVPTWNHYVFFLPLRKPI